MYEGSVAWMWNLIALGKILGAERIVCNLFPASKTVANFGNGAMRNSIFKIQIRLAKAISGDTLVCSVDTDAAAIILDRVGNLDIKVFPLVSALEEVPRKKTINNEHSRVLLNIRDFNQSDLNYLMQSSCKQCAFVLPRGPLANPLSKKLLENHPNLIQDSRNIPEEDYLQYIDSFDYMIFLYQPSLDSSGKLLDALALQIPVCIPEESKDLLKLVSNNIEYTTFSWVSHQNLSKTMNHPEFIQPEAKEIESRLNHLQEFIFTNSESVPKKISLGTGLSLATILYVTFEGINSISLAKSRILSRIKPAAKRSS